MLRRYQKGREVHYFLSKNISKISDYKIPWFGSTCYMRLSPGLAGEKFYSYEDFFDYVSRKVVPLYIFCLIKSIEKGENWLKALEATPLAIFLVHYLCEILHEPEIVEEWKIVEQLYFFNEEKTFKSLHRIFNKRHHKNNMKLLYEELEEHYPEEMEHINKSFKEVK